MRDIVLIAHDIRSTHNVGSLLRTAECLGVTKVFLTGYTPYPTSSFDERLPHLSAKIDRQIHKTAIGAEKLIKWQQNSDVYAVINELKKSGYCLIALEQTETSVSLTSFKPSDKTAILIGREVEGVDETLLKLCQTAVEIPQFGQKESLNVVQATAIALFWMTVDK